MNRLYRLLFLTLGGVFILGQFGRIELGVGRAIYFQDVALMLLVGLFLLDRRANIRHMIMDSTLGKLFLGVNIWIVLTAVLNFSQDRSQLLTVALYLIRFDTVVLFAVALSDIVKRKIITRAELSTWLIGVTTAIAGLGFFQYFFYPDTRGLQLLGWDDHYYRLISTIFDPGFTGIILVIGGLFALSQLQNTKYKVRNTLALKISFLSSFIALLLTYSRASYLAFFVGVVFLAWRLRKYVLLVLVPIFAVCMLLLPRPGGEGVRLERTASVVSRIDSVSTSFADFSLKDAIVGKGWYWKKPLQPTSQLGSMIVTNHSSATENSYVFIFTSLGIVGVLLFFGVLYCTFQSRVWETTVLVSFLVVGVHALFTNTFLYTFVLILLAVITARSEPRDLEKSQSKQH